MMRDMIFTERTTEFEPLARIVCYELTGLGTAGDVDAHLAQPLLCFF